MDSAAQRSTNQSINQLILEWPKWQATARTNMSVAVKNVTKYCLGMTANITAAYATPIVKKGDMCPCHFTSYISCRKT